MANKALSVQRLKYYKYVVFQMVVLEVGIIFIVGIYGSFASEGCSFRYIILWDINTYIAMQKSGVITFKTLLSLIVKCRIYQLQWASEIFLWLVFFKPDILSNKNSKNGFL